MTVAILETERLVLRELALTDLPATREIVCDELTMQSRCGAWSEDENAEGLRKQLISYKEHSFGRWAVVLKGTNKVIGICGLQWCDADNDKVFEIGYLFNRAYWHNGYAAEAANACKKYAFHILKHDEVFSIIKDSNYPAMNVAIRNGMLIRGRFIKSYNGRNTQHYIFSVRRKA